MSRPPPDEQLELDVAGVDEDHDGLSWEEWFMSLPPTPYSEEPTDSRDAAPPDVE